MTRTTSHPRDVIDGLDVGDEVRVRVGEAAEFSGEVVDGDETRDEATPQSVRVDVHWDGETMLSHGWRFESPRGCISASRDYDGEWVFEVAVVTPDGPETYRVDEFEVIGG